MTAPPWQIAWAILSNVLQKFLPFLEVLLETKVVISGVEPVVDTAFTRGLKSEITNK